MEDKVLKTIRKFNLIQANDKIVIGVSGGPDSICLLHVLNSLKEVLNIDIVVAHINHGLRKEAKEETEYVKEFCKKINIECFIKNVDIEEIARKEKKGIEEMGRKVRYEFFHEVLKKSNSNKIATAHNLNDKIETIFLNIIRGTGIYGLKGIDIIRNNLYIRPLLEIGRDEIEKYCEKNELNPKIDKTNLENIYRRNKVRNELIPYIKKEFNPNILQTVNRLSNVATEENEYLEKQTMKHFKDTLIEENKDKKICVLDLKKFNKLEIVIKRRLILYTINEIMGSTKGIEKVNLDDIIKLCNNNIGNKYLKPIQDLKILIKNKKIIISQEKVTI